MLCNICLVIIVIYLIDERVNIMSKPKGINSLMKYMRDIKGINISGSIQNRKLRYMGYFHGYKE